MAKGGDTVENIITLLFIIFFIFSGFFRKKGKTDRTQKKGPYKPIFPPKQESGEIAQPPARQPVQRRPIQRQARPGQKAPDTLKGIFAEVLEQIGEKIEEGKQGMPVDTHDEGVPNIFMGKPKQKRMKKKRAAEPVFEIFDEAIVDEALAKEAKEKRRVERKEELAKLYERKPTEKKQPRPLKFARSDLKNAVIMAEVLNKPVSLRGRRI